MKITGNNRGAIALKTLVFFILLAYGTFVGYKFTMTYFTKADIKTQARHYINKIKGPTTYSNELAEDLLIKALEENGVYESDKINPVYAALSEDTKYVDYELTYRIRTDCILFKTNWDTIKIVERSEVANRL